MNEGDYDNLPSSEDSNENDSDNVHAPVGTPSLDRGLVVCPFCQRSNRNIQTHIIKCYMKACKKKRMKPLCTCPNHKGIEAHESDLPPKSKERKSQQEINGSFLSDRSPALSNDAPIPDFPDTTIIGGDEQNMYDESQYNISQEAQRTKGPHSNSYVMGRSRVCLGKLSPSFHHCTQNITAAGVKIKVLIDRGGFQKDNEFFICTPNIICSNEEHDNVKDLLSRYTLGDDEVVEDRKQYQHRCSYCRNLSFVRKDICVMKPKSTSSRVDDETQLHFCSIKHLLKFLFTTSENQWNKKILVRSNNSSSTLGEGE